VREDRWECCRFLLSFSSPRCEEEISLSNAVAHTDANVSLTDMCIASVGLAYCDRTSENELNFSLTAGTRLLPKFAGKPRTFIPRPSHVCRVLDSVLAVVSKVSLVSSFCLVESQLRLSILSDHFVTSMVSPMNEYLHYLDSTIFSSRQRDTKKAARQARDAFLVEKKQNLSARSDVRFLYLSKQQRSSSTSYVTG